MEYQMPNPTRIEINCETGVESIIELTDAEVAELAVQAAEDAAAAVAAEAKASAQAKLAALGLTADEIAALSK
jgi:hypothetical protein